MTEASDTLFHVVLYRLSEQASDAQLDRVERAFRDLPGKVEGVGQVWTGRNGSSSRFAAAWGVGVVMTLSDAEARDRFLVHEAHRAISEEAADGFYDDVAVLDLEIRRGGDNPMADRRKLLVSLFNPEEVRAAVAGGADIIDCEDATAKVGMFKPRTIGDIAFAVSQNDPRRRLRISANIGFDLRLYQNGPSGRAVARSLEEVQAKAAQEALGIAAAMDTGEGRPNIVKCGIDGLPRDWITPVVEAVKSALSQSSRFRNHQVICGILETHRPAWEARRGDATVIKNLIAVGQFHFDPEGTIDIRDHLTPEQAEALMRGVTDNPRATLVEPYDPERLDLPADARERLRMMVDLIRAGGADGVMIDTPVPAKMANISLVRLADNPDDPERLADTGTKIGVFDVSMLRWFSEYCAYRFMETWLAGSINAEHAAALSKIEHVDVVLNRGSSSEALQKLYPTLDAEGAFEDMADARFSRRIRASNVAAMAATLVPRQQGG